MSVLNRALLIFSVTLAPLFAKDSVHADHIVSVKRVQELREATRQFLDVNNAGGAGYAPAFGCVTGPDHGARGIHDVIGDLGGDGEVDLAHPEALIYEPEGDRRRLVGVVWTQPLG